MIGRHTQADERRAAAACLRDFTSDTKCNDFDLEQQKVSQDSSCRTLSVILLSRLVVVSLSY